MKLIDEIIDLLTATEPSLENALVKAQVLAHKLGEEELSNWVKKELVGYNDEETVPQYRILPLSIRGNISNAVRRYTDYPLPTMGVPNDMQDGLLNRTLGNSIAVIKEWSTGENLRVPIPPELLGLFRQGLDPSFGVESAWGLFGVGAFTQIIVEVRSRMLDLMLSLSNRFPEEVGSASIKQISKEVNVNGLFKGAIFGDGAVVNLAVGENNHATQSVSHQVIKGDFSSLAKELKKLQILDQDVEDLNQAILADNRVEDHTSGNLGPQVRTWLGGMIAKAGTAAWSLSSQTGAGLLAAALAKYYGFS